MGLVHALRASAEAALGDDDGPLRSRAPGDSVRGSAAARRSLGLLEMLRERTAGNLTETERDTLWTALRAVRARLDGAPSSEDAPAGGERRPLPMAGDGPEPEPGA
ncbi:MAG TPA: DUF1844 domain-containing protein [Trueperaceae bacterium]|nr:DUF1844 domain-containing protein [Trueperaceae bacterium]